MSRPSPPPPYPSAESMNEVFCQRIAVEQRRMLYTNAFQAQDTTVGQATPKEPKLCIKINFSSSSSSCGSEYYFAPRSSKRRKTNSGSASTSPPTSQEEREPSPAQRPLRLRINPPGHRGARRDAIVAVAHRRKARQTKSSLKGNGAPVVAAPLVAVQQQPEAIQPTSSSQQTTRASTPTVLPKDYIPWDALIDAVNVFAAGENLQDMDTQS